MCVTIPTQGLFLDDVISLSSFDMKCFQTYVVSLHCLNAMIFILFICTTCQIGTPFPCTVACITRQFPFMAADGTMSTAEMDARISKFGQLSTGDRENADLAYR